MFCDGLAFERKSFKKQRCNVSRLKKISILNVLTGNIKVDNSCVSFMALRWHIGAFYVFVHIAVNARHRPTLDAVLMGIEQRHGTNIARQSVAFEKYKKVALDVNVGRG